MENKCGCWSTVLRKNVRDSSSSKPSGNDAETETRYRDASNRELCASNDDSQPTESTPPHQMLQFTFQELKSATCNFRPNNKVGEGAFGDIFKGWIVENGTAPAKQETGITVAVKIFKVDGLPSHREWVAEVDFRGKLHHPNLVKLIGYCSEDEHKLLVYEFMTLGSLGKHLFQRSTPPLSWSIRMKIALGAAKGLAFLHNNPKPDIYQDFKTSDILLDSEFNAKLLDFRLPIEELPWYEDHIMSTDIGTYGYVAPEYVTTGVFSSKSDIYSFGVMLVEILTGRRSMDKRRANGEQSLVRWAQPYIANKQKVRKIVDPRLELNYSTKAVKRISQLAFKCINQNPKCRPPVDEVVKVLTLVQNLN